MARNSFQLYQQSIAPTLPISDFIKNSNVTRSSLVGQWFGFHTFIIVAWVQSLVGELRFSKPCGVAKIIIYIMFGLPSGTSGKELACQCSRHETGAQSLGLTIPWRRAWQPTLAFLPRESHGQRSIVGYSPQGSKELDMTEATQHARMQSNM